MARKKKVVEALATIWEVDDALWSKVADVLAEFGPPARFGPDRIDQRQALNGVIYRMRSGVQWNQLPRQFGDDASVHRTFQRLVKRGVIGRLWALLVTACAELGGVDWQWQSFDCALGKARHGGSCRTEPNRPGEAWQQARRVDRGGRRADRDRRDPRQRPRLIAAGGCAGGGDRRAAQSDHRANAALVPGRCARPLGSSSIEVKAGLWVFHSPSPSRAIPPSSRRQTTL
jgi:transposase